MPYREGFTQLRAPFKEDSDALADIAKEAEDYGVSAGEFLAMLGVAWSKARRGQWNPLWPGGMIYGSGGTPPSFPHSSQQYSQAQETDDQRKQREETERKRKEEEERRRKVRLAAARAELE